MPWIRIVAFRTSIITAAFCLGCGVLSTEPAIRWELHPGTVEFYDQPITIEVPEAATVGVPVVVTVGTFGGGCTAQGPTEVGVSGLAATVQPMDSSIVPVPDRENYGPGIRFARKRRHAAATRPFDISQPFGVV